MKRTTPHRSERRRTNIAEAERVERYRAALLEQADEWAAELLGDELT